MGGDNITISLEDDEVVTAIEYYNFPEPGHLKWDLLWRMELCAMSIFTTTTTEEKQYGPFATDCEENATEQVYGEIPTSMSFRDFLNQFSTVTDKGYVGDDQVFVFPSLSGDLQHMMDGILWNVNHDND